MRHCYERHPDCKELRGEGKRTDGGGQHRQRIPDVDRRQETGLLREKQVKECVSRRREIGEYFLA